MAGSWRQILAKERQKVTLNKNRRSRITAFLQKIEELRMTDAEPVEISNKFYIYVDCMINEGYPPELVKEAIKQFNSGIKRGQE